MRRNVNILLIDNYDSFTWNLAQYLGELGARVAVRRNDALTLEQAGKMKPTHVVISPGPGHPRDSKLSLDVVRGWSGRLPILGVCLGHQVIGMLHGADIKRATTVVHGKTSVIHHDGGGIFHRLPAPIQATRYHSLVLDPERIPPTVEVSAWTDDGVVMGIRVKGQPVEGVQFHPESILSEGGRDLLKNFLAL